MMLKRASSILLTLLISTTAAAQTDWFFLSGEADWDTGANWSEGTVPNSMSNVFVGNDNMFFNNATANITADLSEPEIADLRIGWGDSDGAKGTKGGGAIGTVNQSAGTFGNTTGAWHFVAADGPADNPNMGTYNLSGTATYNNVGQFHVGIGGGAGAGNQGFVTVADNATMNLDGAIIGSNDGNFGTLTQTGGEVNANFFMVIGREGGATGTYDISAGSLCVNMACDGGSMDANFLSIGQDSSASGTMNVSGTASVSAFDVSIGRGGTGLPGMEVTGLLTLTGPSASFEALGTLRVGINDSDQVVDAMGTIEFSSTGDVTPIEVGGDVWLNDGSVGGSANLVVDLTGSSVTGDVTLISVDAGTVNGTFAGLPEGASVPDSGNRTITYVGGSGNDIVLLASSTVVDGDFNNDDAWDELDIDALTAAIATMSDDLSFDMNGDGDITIADLTDDVLGWLTVGGANNPLDTGGNPFLVGDANLDGFVDGQDFIEWNGSKFTANTNWSEGNFNADLFVDGQDFIDWNSNKFMSSMTTAVPEPVGHYLTLITLGLAGVAAFRRSCN